MRREEAIKLARKLLALHAKPYDNETADDDNAEFEAIAIAMAKAVLGIR